VLILRLAVPVLLVFLGTGAGCLFPFFIIHPIPAIPAAKMAAVATASMVPVLDVEDDSSSSFREEFLRLLLSEPNLDDVCMMLQYFVLHANSATYDENNLICNKCIVLQSPRLPW
jgi:hypothetical protein